MAKLTIDRDTRNLLWEEFKDELAEPTGSMAHPGRITREEAGEAIARAQRAFATLDALGWDEDDKRAHVELEVGAELVVHLQRLRADIEGDLPVTQDEAEAARLVLVEQLLARPELSGAVA